MSRRWQDKKGPGRVQDDPTGQRTSHCWQQRNLDATSRARGVVTPQTLQPRHCQVSASHMLQGHSLSKWMSGVGVPRRVTSKFSGRLLESLQRQDNKADLESALVSFILSLLSKTSCWNTLNELLDDSASFRAIFSAQQETSVV